MTDAQLAIMLAAFLGVSVIIVVLLVSFRALLGDTRKAMLSIVDTMKLMAGSIATSQSHTTRLIETNLQEMHHYFELLDARMGYPPKE